MNAWLLKTNNTKLKERKTEIIFTNNLTEVLGNQQINSLAHFEVDIRRAPYADNMENNPYELKEILLQNGYELQCPNCLSILSINNRDDFSIQSDGSVIHNEIKCI
ncbi:hypothetical protein ABC382_00925 [Lysinibacillus sp. 1P01SD]|uniref:hypothetical protein n=1 Tax=Lysinibacillus sp. 1P01SD TaxID=3132285 RepID=UPI0039A15AF0